MNQEQREQLAGALALEAQRSRLPRIDALLPVRDGGLVAVAHHPHDRLFDRLTGRIDPFQALEQPLQHSMQQFGEETARQQQQAVHAAQQRQQMQDQHSGMAR